MNIEWEENGSKYFSINNGEKIKYVNDYWNEDNYCLETSTGETYKFKNTYPVAINFGDLNCANSEECNVETTLKYSPSNYNTSHYY